MASLESTTRQSKQAHSDLKQLRKSGRVPAVIHGYSTKDVSAKVDEVEFIRVIRGVGRNGVVELGVNSKTIRVMAADYQFDPLEDQITHIGFLAINMSEKRTVKAPVQLVGKAVDTKESGIVEQPLFNSEVTATSDDIPEAIEVDITESDTNGGLTVVDVKVTGNFKIEDDSAESIVTVAAPTKEPTEEEIEAMGGGQQTKEPEVVSESKEDEGRTEE